MQLGDVIDELHDDYGLTNAGAAKCADLSALQKRTDEVNDLDAGDEHLGRGGLVDERGCGTVDGIEFFRLDGSAFVHRVAAYIEHAPHHTFSDGHGNGRAGIHGFVTAFEALGARHRDGPYPAIAEMLLHLEGQFDGLLVYFVIDGKRVVDAR